MARGWTRPAVLWADGARALLAVNARRSATLQAVWLVALGGGAPAWTSLGAGDLAAVAAGPRALIVDVVTTADRAVRLRGRWLDARVALRALTAGRGALPEGALTHEGAIPLPHRGMEFAAAASDEGALLFQAVIGAERGAASIAYFPRDGVAAERALPMAPSALGEAVSSGDHVTLHWWDERYLPRRRTYRGEVAVGESDGARREPTAFAALDAARTTRHLRCAGAPWVVTVDRSYVRAAREDCPQE
jgi:hypothetical protein